MRNITQKSSRAISFSPMLSACGIHATKELMSGYTLNLQNKIVVCPQKTKLNLFEKNSKCLSKAMYCYPNISLLTSFLREGTFAACFSAAFSSWIFRSSAEPLKTVSRLATWLLSPIMAELSPASIAYRCLQGCPWSPAGQVQNARKFFPSNSKVV